MHRRRAASRLLMAALLLVSCGSDGPTSSTPVPSSSLAPTSDLAPRGDLSLAPGPRSIDGEFSCESIEIVRARFGEPGWSELNRVGFYVFFRGIPEARTRVRVWWDYENEWGDYKDTKLPIGTEAFEEILEHEYDDIVEPTDKLVRVALIVDGVKGHCARNRWVTVYPPGGGRGGRATQTANVGPPNSSIGPMPFVGLPQSEGVRFTVLTTLTIDSVFIEATNAGSLTINLLDFPGATLQNTTTVAVPGPPPPFPPVFPPVYPPASSVRVPIGFTIPPGTYVLCMQTTSPALTFPNGLSFAANPTYPYTIPGVISLDSSALGSNFNYFFFYDWQVTW